MESSNILGFPTETPEKAFLKSTMSLAKNALDKTQKETQKLENIANLKNVLSLFSNLVPDYEHDYVVTLQNFTLEFQVPILREKLGKRLLKMGELFLASPSANVFIEMTKLGVEVSLNPHFTEEILLDVIAILSDSFLPNTHTWNCLAQMNSTQRVWLATLDRVPLKGARLLNFYKELAYTALGNERLLLTLIKKAQEKKFSSSPVKNNYHLNILYATILYACSPPTSIIKEIVNSIVLSPAQYYDFFFQLIKENRKNEEILSVILKKLETAKENANEEDFIHTLNQLIFFVSNLL